MIDKKQAKATRKTLHQLGSRDIFIGQDGKVRTLPAGSTYVGTYDKQISCAELWDDLKYVLKSAKEGMNHE